MPGEEAAVAVAAPPATSGGGESSAPSSAPASVPESTGAPVTPATPTAAPSSAPAAKPVPLAGEDDRQYLQRLGEWKAKQPTTETPAEAKPAEEAKPVEEAKPAETKPEEKPVEETKPGEEAQQPLVPEEEITLDDVGLLDVKQANELLKPVFDQHPELRGPVNKALRLAKEAAPILAMIPDEDTAKFAVENASIYSELQDQFTHIADADSGSKFLAKLAEMSVVKGADGKPVMENGAPVLHESFSNFGMAVFSDVSDFLRSQYEALAKTGDENAQSVLAALDVLRGVTSPSPQATENEEIPQHVREREAEVERKETELRQQAEQAEHQRVEQWNDSMEEEVNEVFSSDINEVLSKIKVPDFNREYVAAEIASGVAQKILANPLFQAQRRNLLQQGFSDQTRQRYVALTKRYARDVVMTVARPILKKAGGTVQQAAAARQERQASQEALSRNEPRGATAVPIPVAQPKTTGRLEQFRQEYRQKTGESPDDRTEVQFLTNKFKWGA